MSLMGAELELKNCSKCKTEKPLSEFGKDAHLVSGRSSWCLQCCRETAKQYRDTPMGLYTMKKAQAKYRNKLFTLEKNEFLEWYDNQPKTCVYCDLPEEHLWAFNSSYVNRPIYRLSLDCKTPSIGYTLDNIVLACSSCNIIKSNMLTFEEMKEIAQKYVKPKWERVLRVNDKLLPLIDIDLEEMK